MALSPGQRLGAYEVLSVLGAGGMGEVYRARDTRLLRDVAIKILPDSFAGDRDRLARFEREAQMVAALNHPNIAAIYGLEESGDSRVLVLELVEGATLADHIARGPMPLADALAIATQIADALHSAHEKGIIHRDLKPANVALGADGQVKVLDFGLAKLVEPAGAAGAGGVSGAGGGVGAGTLSPTLSLAMTQAGMILGTAAYMSPEQAKGRPADKRADVWAFGCVLYEMLAGRRLFESDDSAETLAYVITKEPDWSRLPAGLPEPVTRLLRRCLQKDPRERLHDIADARLEIRDALAAPLTERSLTPAPSSRMARVAWVAASMVTAAALAIAAYALTRPAPDAPATLFTFTPPEGQTLTLSAFATSTQNAFPLPLAISPDGRRVAFLANTPAGRSQIWIRSLDALTARPLAGTEGGSSPFWSPDGRFIAFAAEGRLRKIDVAGGPPVTLTEVANYRGGAWSPSGVIVFAPTGTGALQQVPDTGGSATAATVQLDGDSGHARPTFLPDGRRFFFRVYNRGVFLASLDAPGRTLILDSPDANNVAYSQGHLLFLRETTLMAQPFDLASGTLTGGAAPLLEDVMTGGTPPSAVFSVSESGVLTYVAGDRVANGRQLTWIERDGPRRVMGEPGDYGDLRVSPDGTATALSLLERGQRQTDIWLYDNARGVRTRFTSGGNDENAPVWSPDGKRIAFAARTKGDISDLFVKPATGVGDAQPLLVDAHSKIPLSWSHDGRFLLYVAGAGVTGNDLMVLPMAGDPKAVPYLATPFNEVAASFSPDDRSVVYVSNESGRNEIYVAPFPEPSERLRISTSGGNFPRWSPDGRSILYVAGDKLVAADLSNAGGRLRVDREREAAELPGIGGTRFVWDIARDGRIVANLLGSRSTPAQITVVMNWPSLLRR